MKVERRQDGSDCENELGPDQGDAWPRPPMELIIGLS